MRKNFISLLFLLLTGCAFIDFRDSEYYGKGIAGNSPENCGDAYFDKASHKVDSCVARNIKLKRNFYAWYWEEGIDSNPACGIALNDNSELYVLGYDEGYMFFAPTFHAYKCESWKAENKNGKQIIFCEIDERICKYNEQMNGFIDYIPIPANKSHHSQP